jgi:hypothetical protein
MILKVSQISRRMFLLLQQMQVNQGRNAMTLSSTLEQNSLWLEPNMMYNVHRPATTLQNAKRIRLANQMQNVNC